MKQQYGLQLYSVRDAMEADFEGTLKKVAEMGYTYVEFAGFFGHSAEEVKALLDKYGLIISGTHTNFTELTPDKIEETLKYHKTIGNPRFIAPSASLATLEKIEETVDIINYAQPILEAEGIKLGFHNHSREFEIKPWGTTQHTELEKRTSIEFEIDTFWAWNAGTDPVQVIDRLKDRISVIHLKDGFKGGKGIPLGEGEAPVAEVRKKAIEMGILMVVESETLTPSGLDEAQRCINYLRSLDEAE